MNFAFIVRLILLGMIWGASFLFQRVSVPVVGAGMTAAARMILGALTLVVLLLALRKPLEWRRNWRNYLLVGFTAATLPFLLFAFAAYYLPAGYIAVLNSTVPMFTVVLASFAGTHASLSKWLGVVVGFLGVFTLARFGVVGMSMPVAMAFFGLLIASLSYAFTARAVQERFKGVDPLVVAAGNMIGGTLPLLPVAVLTWPAQMPSPAVIASLVMIGVVCTGLAYALHFQNIRAAGSERAVTVTFLVPLFALLWGAVFLGEAITWASILGCGLVLIAVALIFEWFPGLPRSAVPVKPVLDKPVRDAG